MLKKLTRVCVAAREWSCKNPGAVVNVGERLWYGLQYARTLLDEKAIVSGNSQFMEIGGS